MATNRTNSTNRPNTPIRRRGRADLRRPARRNLWRMALGPGFAVGPSGDVIALVGRAAQLASEASGTESDWASAT